jgi:hypothetical protein
MGGIIVGHARTQTKLDEQVHCAALSPDMHDIPQENNPKESRYATVEIKTPLCTNDRYRYDKVQTRIPKAFIVSP